MEYHGFGSERGAWAHCGRGSVSAVGRRSQINGGQSGGRRRDFSV